MSIGSNPSAADGYTIIGAGAIGGTLAWHLARAGHHVMVVDTDVEQVRAIRDHGLTLWRDGAGISQPVTAAVTPDQIRQPLHRVLLAVKANATESVARWLAPRLASDGYVVSLQNGLNEPVLAHLLGERRIVGAFVDLFADVIQPGVISDGGGGALAVGELNGDTSERVCMLVRDLQVWGPAQVTTNVFGFLWSKLGFGAMLIATALCNAPMADLLDRHRASAHALAAEVFAVGAAVGIELEPFDAFEPSAYLPGASRADGNAATDRLVAWLRGQAKDRSGVWRDIAIRRRPTEVPTHYAPVLALAREKDVNVRLLRAMLQQIAEIEVDPASMAEARLTRLDAQVPRLST